MSRWPLVLVLSLGVILLTFVGGLVLGITSGRTLGSSGLTELLQCANGTETNCAGQAAFPIQGEYDPAYQHLTPSDFIVASERYIWRFTDGAISFTAPSNGDVEFKHIIPPAFRSRSRVTEGPTVGFGHNCYMFRITREPPDVIDRLLHGADQIVVESAIRDVPVIVSRRTGEHPDTYAGIDAVITKQTDAAGRAVLIVSSPPISQQMPGCPQLPDGFALQALEELVASIEFLDVGS